MLLPAPPSPLLLRVHSSFTKTFSLRRVSFFLATQPSSKTTHGFNFSILFLDFSMASVEHLTVSAIISCPCPVSSLLSLCFFVLWNHKIRPDTQLFRPCRAAVSAHAANFVYFFELKKDPPRYYAKKYKKKQPNKNVFGNDGDFFPR
jgi:hypothetical protein